MRINLRVAAITTIGLAAIAASSGAQAKSPLRISAELGIVSDYRFRGVSLSGGKPAFQGGLTVEHASGFYAGTWASSIDATAGGATAEVDWLAGYATTVGSKLNLDLSVAYYTYPSDNTPNYAEGTGTVSYAAGLITPKVGVSYAPKQKNLRDEFGIMRDNLYAFTGLGVEFPGTPITLTAQVGYENGLYDLAQPGGKWDWQVGGTIMVKGVDLGLAYVDSNVRYEGDERNLAGAKLIASALISW